MEIKEQPVVSVAVITYNSSKTVIETLDSIYNQTYPNIELIISDDCSTDNTISICRDWIEQHKDRFVRVEILTIEKNTGVSANMNRALNACSGEWIKSIAGDDILETISIEEYIGYVQVHKDIFWCFSQAICFGVDEDQVRRWQIIHESDFYNWTRSQLLDYLHFCGTPFFSATSFINNTELIKTGIKADERVRNAEDRTLWIQMIEAGFKIGFVKKRLVRYRISESSLSTRRVPPQSMILANQQFDKYYAIPYIWRKGYRWYAFRLYMINEREMTKSFIWKVICKIAKILFGPVSSINSVFNIRYAYWLDNEENI